jgi:hypothetical protein
MPSPSDKLVEKIAREAPPNMRLTSVHVRYVLERLADEYIANRNTAERGFATMERKARKRIASMAMERLE